MIGIARELPTRMVEKVWGRANLPSPFAAPKNTRIGELWFAPPPEMSDILVKYLFTSEKLSVQVHPSVHNARDGEVGKEECWLVLDARPGAKLAIGFDADHSSERIEAAAKDGSIEELLTWHEAKAGDVFYLPAGTVHAIGPGLALVEVQQNSDTTFRLYDYGRPRALHLDRALAVARRGPYKERHKSAISEGQSTLIDGPFFRLDRIEGEPDEALRLKYSDGALVLPLEGEVRFKKTGEAVQSGGCLYAPSLGALDFGDASVTLLTRSQR
ncbi:MAG: class I mannose-6-phosphate isomerase [Pseudomonadota bacterium]